MVKVSVAKSENNNIKYLPKVQKQNTNSAKNFEEFLATKINDIKCSNNDEKIKIKTNDEKIINKNTEETSEDKQEVDRINNIVITQIKAELEKNNTMTEAAINQTLEQINLNKEINELTDTLKEGSETKLGSTSKQLSETNGVNYTNQLNEISLRNEPNQLDNENISLHKDYLKTETELMEMNAVKQDVSIKEKPQSTDNVRDLHEKENVIIKTNASENIIKINEQQQKAEITSGKSLPPEAEKQIPQSEAKTYTKENIINKADALIKEVVITNNQELKGTIPLTAAPNENAENQGKIPNHKAIIEGSKLVDEGAEPPPKKADVNLIKEEKSPFFSGIYSGKESAISTEINKEKLVNQVENFILKGHSKGEKNFTVRLSPEGLGQIKVELKYIGSKLEVKIIAENIDTSKVLTEQISQLKKALGANNIDVLRVDVDVDARYKFDLSSNQHRGFEQGRDNNKAGSQNNKSDRYNFDGVNDSDFQNQEGKLIYYDRKQILNYIV